MSFISEARSVFGHSFVALDGEGVIGDEYALLDSSYHAHPRLYTGKRLTTLECLDWLWNLAREVGYAKFIIYGGRYDYDNWIRDIPDLETIKTYASGDMVRFGPYGVVYKRGYVWEVRRIASESPFRYDRIRVTDPFFGRKVDVIGVKVSDVAPFWQKRFTVALDDTLGDEAANRTLIEQGKVARGSFTHENIEWLSSYNRSEVDNLARMAVRLDDWFDSVDIRPDAYNGPGAAAKAVLRRFRPYEHAGRRVSKNRPGAYVATGWNVTEMLKAACSAYAGGRNQILWLGMTDKVWSYDINSAYPDAMTKLPCLSHGRWIRTYRLVKGKFGIYRVRYKASLTMPFYPFFWRDSDGSIAYPSNFQERWMYDCELEMGLTIDPDGICIMEGRYWEPTICENPNPFWFVRKLSEDRLSYKLRKMHGPSTALKLPLNSLYGSIAQARGASDFVKAPWTQQILWAGWITAYTRSKLTLAAMLAPESIVHMATDGLIACSPLPLAFGDSLGEWEQETLTDVMLVQYGIYFSKEKNRWRGFMLEEEDIPEFRERIKAAWLSNWRSIAVNQRLFVTSALVANGQYPFEDFCRWYDVPRTLNLDVDTSFEQGQVTGVDRLYPIHDMTKYYGSKIGSSTLYKPKWGVGGGFPWEERDAIDEGFEVAAST